MKLSDFRFLQPDLFRLKAAKGSLLDPSNWQVGEEISLLLQGDSFYVHQSGAIFLVEAETSADGDILAQRVERGASLWVLRKAKPGALEIQGVEVAMRIDLDLTIGIDDGVVDHLYISREIGSRSEQLARSWLRSEFILENAEKERAFAAYYEYMGSADFQILGRSWCAGIARPSNSPPTLVSLMRFRNQQPVPSLLEGTIDFVEAGIATAILDPVNRRRLDAALDGAGGGYGELWREYGQLEWQEALSVAISVGKLQYDGAEMIGDEYLEWKLTPRNREDYEAFRERLSSLDADDGIKLEIATEAPEWLLIADATINPSQIELGERKIRGNWRLVGTEVVIRPDGGCADLMPGDKGVLYVSLAGHFSVQQRRERARESINRGRQLPQLRYFLEGVALPVPRGFTRRRVNSLSPYTREIFRGPPTEMQQKAIQVALNTPDLAVIVGPPGTGKTQVIAAIQRRLAEESTDRPYQHQILVSSFQHDAVENALTRSDVFGLPPIKVGERPRRGEDSGIDPVQSWCRAKHEVVSNELRRLEEREPHIPLLNSLRHEIAILRISALTPVARQARLIVVDGLLKSLDDLKLPLPQVLKDSWSESMSNISARQSTTTTSRGSSGLLRFVRAIRVTAAGFADDGADRCAACLRALHRNGCEVPEEVLRVLQDGSDSRDATDQSVLLKLGSAKDNLLHLLLPDFRPPEVKNLIEPPLAEILNQIELAFDEHVKKSRRGVAAILANYCDALINEPARVREAANSYSFVIGATCQQSASTRMANLKKLSSIDGSESITFDTVIIDEAARANPLDLFIPMSMATRRIILVGDHLQLPHLLDPDLESELAEKFELQETQKEALKHSLFERLVRVLRQAEDVDKVSRVVMLDTQYRMHPILGDFISKVFYESVGEKRLEPGRPAEHFNHALPGYEGKVCAWIDVPYSEGEEERGGTGSRRRRCEARRIAVEVKRLMEAAPDLTFGVITFYSAQRDVILREMLSHDITEQTEDGIKIRPHWREVNGAERLRIGTVDAFQGKEFDVVLLSTVRSNIQRPNAQDKEFEWNRRYGFLRLPNRLNVAMSRQRCLLIAVGDMAMAEDPDAATAVPGLHKFSTLCRGSHGTVC